MPNKHILLKRIQPEENLYHYTKCRGVQGILKDKAFFATKSDFLNDTNEMRYTLALTRDVLTEFPILEEHSFLRQQLSLTTEEMKRQCYYVLSFSVEADSITLWSEFGNNTGYNLEFKSGELLDMISRTKKISYHGLLIYSRETQRKIIHDLLTKDIPQNLGCSFDDIMKNAAGNGGDEAFRKYCKQFKKAMSIYAVFFKQEEFAAEKEYRVVLKETSDSEVHYREKDGFLLPYIRVNLRKAHDAVNRITVAPQNHVDLAKEGMQMYARQLGYSAEVCLSKINLRY